jgi:hypothetical protein
MLHTANLMVSGGMGTVSSPLPGQQPNNSGLDPAAARPGTRKSQIIEEEEDVEDMEEDIEEVDEFDPADEVIPGSPDEIIKPQTPIIDTPEHEHALETGSPSSTRKPVLAPSPDLDSSPLHPPRSSSLRAPRRPGTATTVSEDGVESSEPDPQDKDKDNAGSEKASVTAAVDYDVAAAKPAT